jgi:hypothetical protein
MPIIPAGTDIRFSGGAFAIGTGFAWNLLPVPEPSTTGLMFVGAGFAAVRVFQRRTKASGNRRG